MNFKETEDADARRRIAVLEGKANQHSHVIAMLQDKVTQPSTDFDHLVDEVSALRSASVGIQRLSKEVPALKTQIGQKLNDPVVEQLHSFNRSRFGRISLKEPHMLLNYLYGVLLSCHPS
jgi:hypothetical protein